MTTATARDLEADLATCEAATPGPWRFNGNEITTISNPRCGIAGAMSDKDCEFIAASREGWPYAIRRVLELEERLDKLRNELQIYQEQERSGRGPWD